MRAIIMCGGLGTRLRPYTFTIPKPLFPIGDKPILELIINNLKKFGFNDIILVVGYQSEIIKSYFNNGAKLGVNISYFEEKEPLGTAGALSSIKERFNINETVLVINGDILTNIDFSQLIKFHKENNSDLTVAVRKHNVQLKYGIIEIDNNKINSIKEKPSFDYIISAGIYLLEPNCLDLIPLNQHFDFPILIQESVRTNKKVMSYLFDDDWVSLEHVNDLEDIDKFIRK